MGRAGRPMVRLLARNTPPVWPCAFCGHSATLVCAYCRQYQGDGLACSEHRRQRACGDEKAFLPIVNSTRMGVWGYTAQT